MKTYGRKRSRPNGRRDEALLLSPLLPFPPRASVSTESTTPITPDGLARGTATLAATPSPGERRALKPGTRGCAPGSGSVPTSQMGAGSTSPAVAASVELSRKMPTQSKLFFTPAPASSRPTPPRTPNTITNNKITTPSPARNDTGATCITASAEHQEQEHEQYDSAGARAKKRARRKTILSSVSVCSLAATPPSSSKSLGALGVERREFWGNDESVGGDSLLLGVKSSRPWNGRVGGSGTGKRRQGPGTGGGKRTRSSVAMGEKKGFNAPATEAERMKGNEQTFLDFGQRSLGKRILCQLCDMLYVCGSAEDEARHAATCARAARGVEFSGWKQERVKARFPDDGGRIIEIRDGDPAAHRSKLQEVQRLMDADMGFAPGARGDDGQPSGDSGGRCRGPNGSLAPKIQRGEAPPPPASRRKAVNAFLYIRGKRVLGCVVAERIESARRAVPEIQRVVRPSTEGMDSDAGDTADGVRSAAAGPGGAAGKEDVAAAAVHRGQGNGARATAVLQLATTAATNAGRGKIGVGGSDGGDAVAAYDHDGAGAANGSAGNPTYECGKMSADSEMSDWNHKENVSDSAPAEAGSKSPLQNGRKHANGVTAAFGSSTDGCCDSQPEGISTEQPRNDYSLDTHELPVCDSGIADDGVRHHFRGSQLRDWSSGRVAESRDDDKLCFDAAKGHRIEAIPGSPVPMLTSKQGDGTTQNPTADLATAAAASEQHWEQMDPERETVPDQGSRAVDPVGADGETSQDQVGAKEEQGTRAMPQYKGNMGPPGTGAEKCRDAAASVDEGASVEENVKTRRGGLWAYFGRATTIAAGGENTVGENRQRTGGKRGSDGSFRKSGNGAGGVEQQGDVVPAASPNRPRSPDAKIKLTPHPDSSPHLDDGYETKKKRKPNAGGEHLPEAIDMAAVDNAAEDRHENHGSGGGAGRGDRGGRHVNVKGERGDPLQQTLSRFFSATPHRLATVAECPVAAPIPEAAGADSTAPLVAGGESPSPHNSAASGGSTSIDEGNVEVDGGEKRQDKRAAAEHGSTTTGDGSDSGEGGRGGTISGNAAVPESICPQQGRRAELEDGRRCNIGEVAVTERLPTTAETGGSSNEMPLAIKNPIEGEQGYSGGGGGREGSGVTTLMAAAMPTVVAQGRDRAFSMDSDSSSCSAGCFSEMRKNDAAERGRGEGEEEAVLALPSVGLSVEDEEVPAVIGILQMWVHAQNRRQGVAMRLVDTIREKLVYGCPLRRDQIAFSQPTREGQAFATRYTGNKLLVY